MCCTLKCLRRCTKLCKSVVSVWNQSHGRICKIESRPCCVFRSVPRGRKQSADKTLKSPSLAKIPSQQMVASGEHAGDTVSLLEGRQMLDNSTPHSKTANRLAALQMSSPGYTPSPMPLRRRLQQDQPLQGTASQVQCDIIQDDHDVICID